VNWRPALAGVLAVAGISVLGVAVVGSSGSTPAAPAASTAPSASAVPAPAVASASSPPISISIPKIGVMTLLGKPLGLNPDGTVQVPDVATPEIPAWFGLGTRPGDPGNAVIIGHVDGGSGGVVKLGVFHGLSALAPGDQVKVGRENGTTVTYSVTAVQVINKGKFPSAQVYGPTSEPWLQLVTCFGPFSKETGNYADSLIVYSKLVQ
jgi:Sortase domain